MTLSLTQTATAVGPYITASFLGVGGTEPYVYTVATGGAGGTVDADSGVYTAPSAVPSDPKLLYDTIVVTDDDAVTASSQILVGSPLLLFCEIIQHEMGLANGRVYLWDQKILQPNDSGLYVAVSVDTCRPFSNNNRLNGTSGESEQYTNMLATIGIDIISRGPSARDRKEEVILALNSFYAQRQQEANSFYIGKVSTRFINLSTLDGAAIPYRFRISVNMQYCFTKAAATDYIDDYSPVDINTDD